MTGNNRFAVLITILPAVSERFNSTANTFKCFYVNRTNRCFCAVYQVKFAVMDGKPNYNNIRREDLQSNNMLCDLLQHAVSKGIWSINGEQDILDFHSLAEKSLQDDKTGNPGGLFRYLIESKKTDMISNYIEYRARNRINANDRYDILMSLQSSQSGQPRLPSARIYTLPVSAEAVPK